MNSANVFTGSDGLTESTNMFEATVDTPLPEADPNKPNVYVKCDYMSGGHSHQPSAAALNMVRAAFSAHINKLRDDPRCGVPERTTPQTVIIDFGAEWCHPCKQLDPIVEELAADWEGKVRVVKLEEQV